MKKFEYRTFFQPHQVGTEDGWYYDYTDAPGAEPYGPFATKRLAEGRASNAHGPTNSDYLA